MKELAQGLADADTAWPLMTEGRGSPIHGAPDPRCDAPAGKPRRPLSGIGEGHRSRWGRELNLGVSFSSKQTVLPLTVDILRGTGVGTLPVPTGKPGSSGL